MINDKVSPAIIPNNIFGHIIPPIIDQVIPKDVLPIYPPAPITKGPPIASNISSIISSSSSFISSFFLFCFISWI